MSEGMTVVLSRKAQNLDVKSRGEEEGILSVFFNKKMTKKKIKPPRRCFLDFSFQFDLLRLVLNCHNGVVGFD